MFGMNKKSNFKLMSNYFCVGTGHRPNKLAPSNICYSDKILYQLIQLAENHLIQINPNVVVSGMALGWDFALAIAAIQLKIPLIAAVPFKGQESKWTIKDQKRYHKILAIAAKIQVVSPGEYSAKKMLKRDKWMVDLLEQRSGVLLALWNGERNGGTWHTVNYARRRGTQIINTWQDWINR